MTGKQARYRRARQIAAVTGVDLRTVRRWIANGTLPSIKLGGARLVSEDDLLRLLQS
jgi:excisionase family DNA binding protein